MNYGILGLVCFIGALVAGRWINERALQKLTKKETEDLVKGLSGYRLVSMIGVVAIVVAYLAFSVMNPDSGDNYPKFATGLIIYMLGGTAYVFFKLKRLAISEDYINAYLLSSSIQYVGIVVLFGLAEISK